MRYEVWKIDDFIITFEIEKRFLLNFTDDGTECFQGYNGYMEDKGVLVKVEDYGTLSEKDNAELLTWFEIPEEIEVEE